MDSQRDKFREYESSAYYCVTLVSVFHFHGVGYVVEEMLNELIINQITCLVSMENRNGPHLGLYLNVSSIARKASLLVQFCGVKGELEVDSRLSSSHFH